MTTQWENYTLFERMPRSASRDVTQKGVSLRQSRQRRFHALASARAARPCVDISLTQIIGPIRCENCDQVSGLRPVLSGLELIGAVAAAVCNNELVDREALWTRDLNQHTRWAPVSVSAICTPRLQPHL